MSNLIFKDNNIRTNGNLVCLTDMAKPYGKLVTGWTRLDSTQAYLEALSVDMQISITLLIEISDAGTFAHPEVAIAFAQWLSPEFHVWCIRHLRTLMEKGKVELAAKQPKPLPLDFDFQLAMGIDKINSGTLPATVKQLLIDNLVNKYIDNTPKLVASTERWVGLVQKAEELGFKTNSSNRVKLGHYGTKEQSRLTRQREERLCNGEMRSIWVYLDNKELEIVIREYFAIEAINA